MKTRRRLPSETEWELAVLALVHRELEISEELEYCGDVQRSALLAESTLIRLYQGDFEQGDRSRALHDRIGRLFP